MQLRIFFLIAGLLISKCNLKAVEKHFTESMNIPLGWRLEMIKMTDYFSCTENRRFISDLSLIGSWKLNPLQKLVTPSNLIINVKVPENWEAINITSKRISRNNHTAVELKIKEPRAPFNTFSYPEDSDGSVVRSFEIDHTIPIIFCLLDGRMFIELTLREI